MRVPRDTGPALILRATDKALLTHLSPCLSTQTGREARHTAGGSCCARRPRGCAGAGRVGELGTAAVCVGSVLCSQLAPGLGPPWVGGEPRRQPSPVMGWGLCTEHGCPEQESRAVSVAPLLFLPWPLSVPLRSLGRKPGVGRWAGAHSPLSQRKWLACFGPACRNCVDGFSGPRKEF